MDQACYRRFVFAGFNHSVASPFFCEVNSFLETIMSRVIVADDNFALANVVRFHLGRAGHDVTVVKNGKDVLEKLRAEQFDLLITDQQMPFRTGLEVCSEVRENIPHCQGMPIVLLTAKRLEMEVESLEQKYGISRVFSKPFSPSELVETVGELLSASVG